MGACSNKEPLNKHSSTSLSNLDRQTNSNDKFQSSSSSNKLNTGTTLKMPITNTYRCDRCSMVFPTDEALYKHRTRFCIGAMTSNTERRYNYSNDDMNGNQRENYPNNQSPYRRVLHQSPVDKKREEINEWKTQRSILQSVQDMEDRILRDSQKTEKLANNLKKRTLNYNQILTEYEQLQAHERDLLRQMFNLQGQSGPNNNNLTEHERKQLEILQRQNLRLEQERRMIQNKLEELIASEQQPAVIGDYEPYRLLRDMKEEQDRNEKALINLRRRLVYPESTVPSLPYVNTYRRTPDDFTWRFNQDIIPHYSDIERRLYHYEYYPWLSDYPEPLRHYRYRPLQTTNNNLVSYKNENQRLQNELFNMERKFQRLDSRTRQLELTLAKTNSYDPRLNGQPFRSLNNTSSNFDNNEFLDQYRQHQQITTTTIRDNRNGTMNNVNLNLNRLRDPLAPQPYDPIGGFVIFFDFIVNLPSTIDQCRLITCIHHSESGLGEPSQLQPFKCELYTDETNGERMGIVLIATKQPVPRCSPHQGLSIIIEIQVTSKQTSNDVLRTQAWTKIPLFDQRNRLLSGRWKVPIKSLPIHQNENFSFINSLPTFGRAELHYRLVNFQDAVEQSNSPLSPSLRDLYFFPPQYRNGSYM